MFPFVSLMAFIDDSWMQRKDDFCEATNSSTFFSSQVQPIPYFITFLKHVIDSIFHY